MVYQGKAKDIMKVLWLYHHIPEILLSEFSDANWICGTGWVDGLLMELKGSGKFELGIIFPASTEDRDGKKESIRYYSYNEKTKSTARQEKFEKVIFDFQPDVIHIWGSEAENSRDMIITCEKMKILDRIVLNLQGLLFIYFFHYRADIPGKYFYGFTLRDIIKADNLYMQQRKFRKRGSEEISSLKKVCNVIGRTDWDFACAKLINPNINYYFCNENLRACFYHGVWEYEKCRKKSIFMSQATYPIKGLHYVLRAMKLIRHHFPDTVLRIAGSDYVRLDAGMKAHLKEGSYARYIRKLIMSNGLQDSVTFLGRLNAEEMKQEYLNANVFVSPSTVENESNSLSEAKMLGCPVVASFVGGVTNRISHGYDGYAYQHDAVYMLAHYICEIFRDTENASRMGMNARKQAMIVNDRKTNAERMIQIYTKISETEGKEKGVMALDSYRYGQI